MRYLSLFSGFGGAELAWEPLGWECVAVAEIDPAACAVLKHHWPNVPNLGDIEQITEEQIVALGTIDLVVFGSPCQDLSIIGNREGLGGKRSGLFFDAIRIIRWSRARLALWENVPGAFSSQDGRDFALVVGEMAGVQIDVPAGGWENAGFLAGPEALVEWVVLDAQYFGVPQRRRRIFALRDTGDWTRRSPVLLEPDSLLGDPAPSREAGQRVAHTLKGGSGERGWPDPSDGNGGGLVAFGGNNTAGPIEQATGLRAHGRFHQDFESETFITGPLLANGKASGSATQQDAEQAMLVPVAFKPSHYTRDKDGAPSEVVPPLSADADKGDQDTLIAYKCNDSGADAGEISPTFRSCGQVAIAISGRVRGDDGRGYARPEHMSEEVSSTLDGVKVDAVAFTQNSRSEVREIGGDGSTTGAVISKPGAQCQTYIAGTQIRRLTPTETARLQGVPEDHCRVKFRGKPMADAQIYKMHGNGFCVPVVRWIGARIKLLIESKD
jgi:DNA (cytosine-5)-methyltransferase 1